MYIPIIIDPCSFYKTRYLWEYLKYLYHCKENQWPIISTEYFIDYRENIPYSNVYEEEFYNVHQYKILNEAEESSVLRYVIPNFIFEDLEKELGSKLAVSLYLLANRYRPLERELTKILKRIEKDTKRKIKGFMNWNTHFKSVYYLGKKNKNVVITNEFAIRFPDYRPTAYFCYDEIYSHDEIMNRYWDFQKSKRNLGVELFSRKELLGLFLQASKLFYLTESSQLEKYEIGIAGCHPLISTFFVKSQYTDLELIQDVRNVYSEEDILFRKHPGDEPYQAFYTVKNRDESQSAIEFILKCKRITAQGSNILLEAMLWGKMVYSRDVSPYTKWCESSLENKISPIVEEDFLNYVLLCYLVPYELICDKEYLKWRETNPNEKELFWYHLRFYLKQENLDESILYLARNNRYKKILKERRKDNEV